MRVSVGYGEKSIVDAARVGELRHEADVGERRRVAVAEAARRRFAREPRFERLEADVDPVLVPAVLLLFGDAERAGQVMQHAQVVERMDVAGDRERDRAHARAAGRHRAAATAAADASRPATR